MHHCCRIGLIFYICNMVALMRFINRFSLDLLGFSASTLCAIHCLALPVLILSGSIGSMGVIHNHQVENYILLISGFVGMISLIPSYLNHHRQFGPLLILMAGLIFITAGRLTSEMFWETLFTSIGALTVATAHFVNWKICRVGCAVPADH